LLAQDSDHITHLIGPFHGDVRQKIANEWRVDLIGTNQRRPNMGKNFVDAALLRRRNDIHRDKDVLRNSKKYKQRTRRNPAQRYVAYGGSMALPRSILVLISDKQAAKIDASISVIRRCAIWRACHLDQPFFGQFGRARRIPYRLLTCLNELVTWQRSQVRPSAPRCTSSCW
jgi:hypothetical protein